MFQFLLIFTSVMKLMFLVQSLCLRVWANLSTWFSCNLVGACSMGQEKDPSHSKADLRITRLHESILTFTKVARSVWRSCQRCHSSLNPVDGRKAQEWLNIANVEILHLYWKYIQTYKVVAAADFHVIKELPGERPQSLISLWVYCDSHRSQ